MFSIGKHTLNTIAYIRSNVISNIPKALYGKDSIISLLYTVDSHRCSLLDSVYLGLITDIVYNVLFHYLCHSDILCMKCTYVCILFFISSVNFCNIC